jgi:hypothetical protein
MKIVLLCFHPFDPLESRLLPKFLLKLRLSFIQRPDLHEEIVLLLFLICDKFLLLDLLLNTIFSLQKSGTDTLHEKVVLFLLWVSDVVLLALEPLFSSKFLLKFLGRD